MDNAPTNNEMENLFGGDPIKEETRRRSLSDLAKDYKSEEDTATPAAGTEASSGADSAPRYRIRVSQQKQPQDITPEEIDEAQEKLRKAEKRFAETMIQQTDATQKAASALSYSLESWLQELYLSANLADLMNDESAFKIFVSSVTASDIMSAVNKTEMDLSVFDGMTPDEKYEFLFSGMSFMDVSLVYEAWRKKHEDSDNKIIPFVRGTGERRLIPSSKDCRKLFHPYNEKTGIGLYSLDEDGRKLPVATEDAVLLEVFGQAMYDAYCQTGKVSEAIGMELTSLCRETGLDTSRRRGESRAGARMRMLAGFEKRVIGIRGGLPNDSKSYPVYAEVGGYDPETDMLVFISPYLAAYLVKEITRSLKQKRPRPWRSVGSSKTPSGAAQQMADFIRAGIDERGTTPDAKLKKNKGKASSDKRIITYSVTYRGIMDECPSVKDTVYRSSDVSTQTQTLKRISSKAVEILKEGNLLEYYVGLKINDISPTIKRLDTPLTITHYGRNEAYKEAPAPAVEARIRNAAERPSCG